MLSKTRHLNILAVLREQPTALIKDLAERLNVSQSTVRRDLDEMEAQGLVRRVFGGVVVDNQNNGEPPFELREVLHAREKDLVCQAAAALIQDGDFVFIDGGTTTELIVPYLAHKRDLTVVTCGLNVAYRLTQIDHINSFVVGGEIHSDSHSITGPLALEMLDIYKFRFTRAIIAASAVSAPFGATNRLLDRIPLKRKAMDISQESILVVDGSKIGCVALGQIAPVEAFAALITDASAPLDELQAIRDRGVKVITAEPA